MRKAAAASHPRSFASQLLSLVAHPRRGFLILLERRRPVEVMMFSAISGVYVAYVAAERLHLADGVGFAPTLVFVLLGGPGFGLLALAFTDVVLTAATRAAGGTADREIIAGVFGYATWPFLPLLVIVTAVELAAYGDNVFSSGRADAPPFVSVLVTILEIGTILLWLLLMVEGTAAAGHLSEVDAARTVGLTFVRMFVIMVLLALIAFAAFVI